MAPSLPTPAGYGELLDSLKARIREARLRAVLSVNRELLMLYWGLGKDILVRQSQEGWGTKVVGRLATDLTRAFPEMKGLSARNLKYMRTMAQAWPDEAIVQAVLAQIPWYHNLALLEKLGTAEERLWYARKVRENGWSRNVLVHHIETKLIDRQGAAATNFEYTLPAIESDLARETLKDPYIFEFLDLAEDAKERDLERALLENLRRFMLELGQGFAFVGSQYRIEVGGEDFFVDLLFYHLKLRRYVVMELKTGAFKPADVGQLGFYLTAVDKLLRHEDDKPSIGLLLCREKNRLVAEYALQDSSKPLGIAEYRVLPPELKDALPSVETIVGVGHGTFPLPEGEGTGHVGQEEASED
ncbi:MAG TPA: PDDEXK nuclease domain-containing protein [Polyangiaceae bacterium]|nr:PDDEXK nuclease domain-containing protein [Polyangiaceae bacterium]